MPRSKFHYPTRPEGIKDEDWKPLPVRENKPLDPQPGSHPSSTVAKNIAQGFTRLVDFVKVHSRRDAEAAQKLSERHKVINAYKKLKKFGT